jgi:hypothetical protein
VSPTTLRDQALEIIQALLGESGAPCEPPKEHLRAGWPPIRDTWNRRFGALDFCQDPCHVVFR